MNVEYFKRDDLECVRFSDYDPMDFESLVQSLGDFLQSRSSTPSHSTAEVLPLNDPIAKYQSVEKLPISDLLLYKCHIKPKRRFEELKDNESNILMATWPFHQLFDGLHTTRGHPLLAIHHVSTDSHSIQMDDDCPGELRTRVDIAIECFSANIAKEVGGLLRTGSTCESDIVWKTFVYVKDPEMFCSCLKWKYEETKRIWDENENF